MSSPHYKDNEGIGFERDFDLDVVVQTLIGDDDTQWLENNRL